MKKTVLISVLLGLMLTTTAFVVAVATPALKGQELKGSGNLITKTIDAPYFDEVDVSNGIKVFISSAISDKIQIEADDNVMKYVVVKADSGELKISIDPSIHSIQSFNVTVTIPANGNIHSLDASSASSITSNVQLSADEFEIDASSAAKINANVKANTCSIDASSAAKITTTVETGQCKIDASSASKVQATVKAESCSIESESTAKIDAQLDVQICEVEAESASVVTLTGTVDRASISTSSAAKFMGSALTVKNCTVNTSSGSKATVNATENLKANASSGSTIRYTGAAAASTHESSGGSIRQK